MKIDNNKFRGYFWKKKENDEDSIVKEEMVTIILYSSEYINEEMLNEDILEKTKIRI